MASNASSDLNIAGDLKGKFSHSNFEDLYHEQEVSYAIGYY